MTEEKSYAEKKIRKITENEDKEKAMYQKQIEFMELMEKRYKEACQSLGSEPEAKIAKKQDDGLYTVSLTQKAKSQPEEGQVFSLDHPDLVSKTLTEDQFNQLKKKVTVTCKSVKVELKTTSMQTKRLTVQDKKAEDNIKKLGMHT
jgi:hypothetical protein